jgi:hypothetical protein
VATSYGNTRGVVDNVVAIHRAANPKPVPQMPAKVQPETFKVKTSEPEAQAEDGAPTQPAKPRYVMPALEALKAQQADALPIDTRTAKERDVFNPEFGF